MPDTRYKTWSLTLRELKMGVFENRVLTRMFERRGVKLKRVENEPRTSYSSPSENSLLFE
jgi:hypothetical protein